MKKKVALSATAIAVLASAVPTHVAPVEAAADNSMPVVYVDFTNNTGNFDNSGDGSQERPFVQLTTALQKVQDNGVIIIRGKAFVNDVDSNSAPWHITKNVTIKSDEQAAPSIDIRSGGIILGANVKFENIEFNMSNSIKDIHANGYKLELVNVDVSKNLTPNIYGGPVGSSYPSGPKSEIIVKTDSGFKPSEYGTGKTVLGTIYTSSKGSTSTTPVDIQVLQYKSSSISLTKIDGTGSSGKIDITLDDFEERVEGNGINTTLNAGSDNLRTLDISGVTNLNITKGKIALPESMGSSIQGLSVQDGATLNLTSRTTPLNVTDFSGEGTLLLSTQSRVDFVNTPSNPVNVQFDTAVNGRHEDTVFLTTPKGSQVNFTNQTDLPLSLKGVNNGERLDWTLKFGAVEEGALPKLTRIYNTEKLVTIDLDSLFEGAVPTAIFSFNVDTNPPLTEDIEIFFDQFEPTIKVDNKVAQKVDGEYGASYQIDGLNIFFQPDYDSGDPKVQQMFVEFNEEPTKGTYVIEISKGQIYPLTLTVNIEGLEEGNPDDGEGEDGPVLPPAPPEGGEPDGPESGGDGEEEQPLPAIKDIVFENGTTATIREDRTMFVHDFNFEATDEDDQRIWNISEYPVTVTYNGQEITAEPDGDYFIRDLEVELTVTGDCVNLVGNGGPIAPGEYPITLIIGDITKTLTLVVKTTNPTVTSFSESSYSVHEKGTVTQLATDIKVNFNNEPYEAIEFHELSNAEVLVGDQPLQYSTDRGGYVTADGQYVLSIRTTDELGKYTATLKEVNGNDLFAGKYPFTLKFGEQQTELDFKVKPTISMFSTRDVGEKTITSDDDRPSFAFDVRGNANFVELDKVEDFKITINGEETGKATEGEDGTVYYTAHKSWVKAYIEYDEETQEHTLHLQPFSNEGTPVYTERQYTITLSGSNKNENLTFTVNVEKEEVPPAPPTEPSTPDTTVITYTLPNGQADQEKTITKTGDTPTTNEFMFEPQFTSTTPNIDNFLNGLTVTIGGKEAKRVGPTYLWTAEGANASLVIDRTNDGYKVSFDIVNQSDGSTLDAGKYVATVTYGEDNPTASFTLNVEESKPVDPDPVPPPTPPVDPDPDKPSTEEPGNTGDNGGGSGQPTTPTPPTEPDNKEEEKEEPGTNNGGSSSGGVTPEPKPENPPSSGGTTTQPTNPPSGSGSTGGSSSGNSSTGGSGGSSSGGTTLPAPDPKPEKPTEKPPVVEQPTPVPPKQEETKPTTRPTVKPGAIASAVEALEKLSTTIKEKVDSLLTEVVEQAKGLVLDLTGDKDDLSSVSTLEVTGDGVFASVDGQLVKFATDLKLNDMSKLRITRTDGSPIPYKTDGTGFTITTHNFSDILITERVVEPFVDVAKDDWFQPYVDEMYNRGITKGTTATTFSPNASITRAQLAALLARTYELKPTGDKPALKDTANQWYSENVQALVDNGIIKGYEDGTFRGEQEVTREQLAVMLHRLAEQQGKDTSVSNTSRFTDTDKMTDYGKSAIEWAASEGIINSGNGVAFKPKSTATRAQVAKMLTLFMNK